MKRPVGASSPQETRGVPRQATSPDRAILVLGKESRNSAPTQLEHLLKQQPNICATSFCHRVFVTRAQ